MENTKKDLRRLKVYTMCFLSMVVLLVTSGPTNAQVFTFDYLTYTDYVEMGNQNRYHRGKATAYAFFGVNEFDGSGNATANNLSYKEFHLYLALRIISSNRIQLSIAPQIGLLVAEGLSSEIYGAPWIWAKCVPFNNQGLAFRAGFQFGEFGQTFWLEDNKIDIGFLASRFIRPFQFDGTISYRLRQRSNQNLLDFQHLFNEAGDEVHYKLQIALVRNGPVYPAFMLSGYFGGDKKMDGQVLPDSASRKTSVGVSLHINIEKNRLFIVSLLYDVAGRYDKKGFAIVLNIAD